MDTRPDFTSQVHFVDDYDVGDAFGEHDIEYWVYDGTRLVPASPDEAERLRDLDAQARLAHWRELARRHVRAQAVRGWVSRLAVWPWSLRMWPAHRGSSAVSSTAVGSSTHARPGHRR